MALPSTVPRRRYREPVVVFRGAHGPFRRRGIARPEATDAADDARALDEALADVEWSEFPDGTEPQKNELSWSVERHAPYTLAFEYDTWTSAPLNRDGAGQFSGEITVARGDASIELLTTHTHTVENLPLSVSSPLLRADTH